MAVEASQRSFDAVSTYNRLILEDADTSMSVAAIETMLLGLAATPASTVAETLDLVSQRTAELKQAMPHSVSLAAGTDLFQQYLVANLQRQGPGDFEAVRQNLIRNGQAFAQRAKAARDAIAACGPAFIADRDVVLTTGASRIVGRLLCRAGDHGSDHGSRRFRVVLVLDGDGCPATAQALRARGVPVATIPPTAVAHCMDSVTKCVVDAEGIVQNGGVVGPLGTYQMALLARAAGKPFHVVGETHTFARLFPLGQQDLRLTQDVLVFVPADNRAASDEDVADLGMRAPPSKDAVDYTPPHLIAGIITESGMLLPNAVAEEMIKVWV